jgi:hypothetical protein
LDKEFNFWSWIEFWYQLAYFWYCWYHLSYFICFFFMYRLELLTKGVICVIFYVELNFDISRPLLILLTPFDILFCFFNIQIFNLDQGYNFWCQNEFWYQLTYFWYFWYRFTYLLDFWSTDLKFGPGCNFWCHIEFLISAYLLLIFLISVYLHACF